MIQVKQHSDAIAAFVGVISLLVFALALAACCTGCSHNTVSYGDGIMLETTVNPETYAFGVSLRYGKILTACTRENAEIEMQGGNTTAGGTASGDTTAKTEGSVKVKIGQQITGYYVDAIAAGAKAKDLNAYTAAPEK